MNYAKIIKEDLANGLGVRVSLFVSGCTHKCKGCFNKEAWDFSYGKIFDKETEDKIIKFLNDDKIKGLSLLGGDPLMLNNRSVINHLIQRIKRELPSKDIYLWTGYTLQELERIEDKDLKEILDKLDYLIDGRFIEKKKDRKCYLRGSTNQKIYKKENGCFKRIKEDRLNSERGKL